MAQFSNIAIIFNPNSTGDARSNAKQLQKDLHDALPKLPVELLPTKRAGHAVDLSYAFAKDKKRPLIISASGDGGYNEVINGAIRAQNEGAKPVCAVLPSGNANDHARTMHDKPLLDMIVENVVTELDVLEVSILSGQEKVVRYAHSYAGIGLTPTVAVELNKHTLNSLKEAWIVTKTFWNYRPVYIRMNDKKLKLDSLICSTIPEMAKLLTLSTTAHPQDGKFEVITFKHHKKVTLVLRLLKGVVNQLGAESQTDKLKFTLLIPAPMQIDGEVVKLQKDTEISIAIRGRLLNTLATV